MNAEPREKTTRLLPSEEGKGRSFSRIPQRLQYVTTAPFLARIKIGSRIFGRSEKSLNRRKTEGTEMK
jgi:hypothetical protein